MSIFGKILSLPIHGYRLFVSPLLPPSCRYQPTCSAYALEAIGRHGALKGMWLGLRRIGRCHPWGSSGYDPVPGASDTDIGLPHECDHSRHDAAADDQENNNQVFG